MLSRDKTGVSDISPFRTVFSWTLFTNLKIPCKTKGYLNEPIFGNRKNGSDYDANYQRHHIIPIQAVNLPDLCDSIELSILQILDIDDFKSNGVLLPCTEEVAFSSGYALHRGPHPHYNKLVIERLCLIDYLGSKIDNFIERQIFLRMKLDLLQLGLRRCLVGQGFAQLRLNRRDPGPVSAEFLHIDARVDVLCKTAKWRL